MQEKEYIEIGKLNIKLFEEIGEHLITDEVIFTYERLNHVETKRIQLFNEVKHVLPDVIYNPDYIYKDWNNRENTLVLIKSLDKKLNLNVILKIAILNDEKHQKNSIITMIKIGNKTFNKIKRNKKENLLFKKLDNYE
ncbi:MAG TPA: hypothetical protein DCZ30_06350 [Clostridiales bacterium]|nr:hypothetical protein [Clostridiales bacterium]